MSIFTDWFKRKSIEIVPVAPVRYDQAPVTSLRVGTWVKTPEGRIGILTYLGAVSEVTLTTASGGTVMELSVNDTVVPKVVEYPINQLKRASISEIPVTRYESREQLLSLGYGD
jgi:hypothetical protein